MSSSVDAQVQVIQSRFVDHLKDATDKFKQVTGEMARHDVRIKATEEFISETKNDLKWVKRIGIVLTGVSMPQAIELISKLLQH